MKDFLAVILLTILAMVVLTALAMGAVLLMNYIQTGTVKATPTIYTVLVDKTLKYEIIK